MDLVALAQDGAGAQEADPGHDLSCDTCRVGGAAKSFEPQPRKQTCADSDQAQRFDSGRMAVKLPLYPEGHREDRGDEEAKREVGVAGDWQSASAPSATAAGLVLGPGLVGKLG